jgi:hypothetical protein
MVLHEDPSWLSRRIPIYYLDEGGERVPSWPDRFDMKFIEGLETRSAQTGQMQGFRAEYLCDPDAPEAKVFKSENLVIEPRVRKWEAIYTMTDPARTVNRGSADTGHAAWSWIGNRLIIWDGWARQLMPDQIVKAIFDSMEELHPIWTGVEEDGLNQWLMQPIRAESIRRGISLPVKAVKAPPGKRDFIRGLQPFFMSSNAVFTKPMPELREQLLGFPLGKIDAPNALAYALKMRPGSPIYEDFGDDHIDDEIRPQSHRQSWLALNATPAMVTGMLLQSFEGSIRIFGDWVLEGDPQTVLTKIVGEAQAIAGRRVELTAGPLHFDQFNNVGLRQAALRANLEIRQGVPPAMGRASIADMLSSRRNGQPRLHVASDAIWTLNAFADGYCRTLEKDGYLADYAEPGPYRTLMEGLESLCGLFEVSSPSNESSAIVYGRLPNGQKYVTARR